MKRTSIMMAGLLLGTLLITFFVFPVGVKAITINIVSDTTWTVSDSNGNYLGNAQNVCLNAMVPSNCPAGATLYGFARVAWKADLSSIPGATWIWAPNITGATPDASGAVFTFQKEFYLCDTPQDGTISVAADNSAEVLLNGKSEFTYSDNSALHTQTIPANDFVKGLNIIQVRVTNALGCAENLYQCNPAGVVLGASFADASNALPTCTDNGKTFTVGQFETLSCPAGKTGSRSRPCICIGSTGFWGPVSDMCESPPPTCTDNGRTYNVGDIETLPCPAGQTGSASRTCQANGTWGPTNSSTCHLPQLGAGDICWTVSQGYTGTCPAGTECKDRHYPGHKAAWYCPFIAWIGPDCDNSPPTVSTDSYCDP